MHASKHMETKTIPDIGDLLIFVRFDQSVRKKRKKRRKAAEGVTRVFRQMAAHKIQTVAINRNEKTFATVPFPRATLKCKKLFEKKSVCPSNRLVK